MRVELIADFREEGWPSMDLAAELLVGAARQLPGVDCVLTRPRMWRASPSGSNPRAFERAFGRFVQYPLRVMVRGQPSNYYHIADHSYGHLAHLLPRERTGIYCHDLDAFRDGLSHERKRASRRLLSKLLLSGLRKAAVVFYSTDVVRQELLDDALLSPSRLVHAPFGIAPEFTTTESSIDIAQRERLGAPYLLNVGSCIPRKNICFLLEVFAALRREQPHIRL